MMKKVFGVLLAGFSFLSAFSQSTADSLQLLDEVTVRAFEQNRKSLTATAAVRLLTPEIAGRYNKVSLVDGFNSIAGVRMEERSPGSYRINIRGSSLRSPFGVRNVKVYWNNIPVTDPGGNTYFNQFALNNFSGIEIFKGPAGSLYGAGTGGLVLMQTLDNWQPGAKAEYITGSYNLQNVLASARFGTAENQNQFTYAHTQSDGYRAQSRMRRDNASWTSRISLSAKQQLTASFLFTDMYYQTPGALTAAEFANDPTAARPAGAGFPGAVAAKAAIFQKNLLAGLTNEYTISPSLKNTTSLYGAFAQIRNSAIRNYERRNEPHLGGRSVFQWSANTPKTNWQLVGGAEFQQGYFNIQVAKNNNGNPDTLQTNDDIRQTTYSFFLQGDAAIAGNWFLTAGISFNKNKVSFTRLSQYPVATQRRSYQAELAPRVALLKKFSANLSVLATVSRGFSPPTTAELLPSTGIISTELEAERGWNYELTARYSLLKNKLNLEATGFYFKLDQALVQRRDIAGADYFTNAGDIRQRGLELHADYTLVASSRKIIDYLLIKTAYTYNHFRYGSFVKNADDFSGNEVPSVPANTFAALADLQLLNGLYFNLSYYSASRIFLNDANTATAKAYPLAGIRAGWKKTIQHQYRIAFYAGVDNLLDKTYSLGNDINAAGNRFFNAAPRRNFYTGIILEWIKPSKQ